MRLDKFLKDSRLIKRRTIAKQMCDAGKIAVNGKIAKAGTELIAGDMLRIEYATMFYTVEILTVKVNPSKVAAGESYKEISRELKPKAG